MPRFWKQLFLVPLLTVAVMAGCELADRSVSAVPTEPQELLGGLLSGGQAGGYTLVEEPLVAGTTESLSVSGLIGVEGGQVTLLGHTLTVPAGAVAQPTLFTLTALPSGYVEVDLSATVTDALGLVLDVGSKGFLKPVPVTLTYSRATNVPDPGKLVVLRKLGLISLGEYEVMPSKVDLQARTVTAELDHFSDYALGIP